LIGTSYSACFEALRNFGVKRNGIIALSDEGDGGTWVALRSCPTHGANKSELFYRHIYKAGGQNIIANLVKLGDLQKYAVDHGQRKPDSS
jgi:hypothetical protein